MRRIVAALAILAGLGVGPARAEPPPRPLIDGFQHFGVSSCSTAGCHGDQVSGVGAGPIVGQNEYFRWRAPGQAGAHSRAYAVLLNAHSQRIARNLGIGPAHQAKECLACHADNAANRSDRFQLTDGVGCEACHGGAENWLAFHRLGAGHQENLAKGLYPTEQPAARGELCLSCHLGSTTAGQFVSHRLMGAGHPRLKFELDLYTAIQAHHVVDDDYRQRKEVPSGAKVWAIGQALALKRTLDLLTDDKTGSAGAFPELVFFDCHACHQPISNTESGLSWRANPLRALGPGVPVVNDANLIMLIAAARAFDPALAERLESEGRALHVASQQSRANFIAAARRLAASADEMAARLDGADLAGRDTVARMLRAVLDASLSDRYTNYAAAEQALFAVQRLAAELGADSAEVMNAVNRASEQAASPYAYNQTEFRRALTEVAALLQ